MRTGFAVLTLGALAASQLTGISASAAALALPSQTPQSTSQPGSPERTASIAARRSGKPVEVVERTTPTERVVANPDGSFTATTHRRPVRAKKGNSWQAVDANLARNPDGTFSPKVSVESLRISGGGEGPFVTIGSTGTQLSVSWPAPLPKPRINGERATYPDVYPGVDLVVTATPDSFSHVLVVKNAQAAANPALDSIRYGVTAEGLSLTEKDGALSAADATGEAQYTAAPPTMWDTGAEHSREGRTTPTTPGGGRVSEVGLDLGSVDGDGEQQLTLTPPSEALRGTAVRYPVYIDPDILRPRLHFAVARTGKSTIYDNNAEEMRVGYCAWADCNGYYRARSYFSFNIDGLSQDNGLKARITDAQLNILATQNAAGCVGTKVHLHKSGSFSSSTTHPGPTSTLLATSSAFSAGGGTSCPEAETHWRGDYLINYIQGGANAANDTLNFALVSFDDDNSYYWKKFGNDPKLEYTYVFAPGEATNLSVTGAVTCSTTAYVNTPNPKLNAKASDNDPGAYVALRLHFHVYNAKTGLWVTSGTPAENVASGALGTWTSTNLANGDYYFKVNVEALTADNPVTWGTAKYYFTVQGVPTTAPTTQSFDYPNADVYGATPGGTITLGTTGTDPDIVGYSYGWMDPANVKTPNTSTCGYNETFNDSSGLAKGGYVAATNGVATLTVPSNLPSNNAVLYVKSFNASHNMSALDEDRAMRQFMVAPVVAGRTGQRIETEDIVPTIPAGQTSPTYKEGPAAGYWANGYQRHLVATGPGQSFTFPFTADTTGKYALSAQFSKITHYGILEFKIDDDQTSVLDVNTNTPAQMDGYASPYVQFATVDLTGNRLGRTLSAGPHTLTITVVGKNSSSQNCNDNLAGGCLTSGGVADNGYAAGIDFIRLTPMP